MSKKRAVHNRRVFNLLKPYEPPLTGWDKVYDWMLGRARVVMVVAEIIVVIVFFSKAALDIQAGNLEEEIERKRQELNTFSQVAEPTLRNMQNKTDAYKELWNNSSAYTDILAEVDGYVGAGGSDLSVIFNDNELVISGREGVESLSTVESLLKSSNTFSNKVVGNLVSEGEEGDNSEVQLSAEIINLNSREQL